MLNLRIIFLIVLIKLCLSEFKVTNNQDRADQVTEFVAHLISEDGLKFQRTNYVVLFFFSDSQKSSADVYFIFSEVARVTTGLGSVVLPPSSEKFPDWSVRKANFIVIVTDCKVPVSKMGKICAGV